MKRKKDRKSRSGLEDASDLLSSIDSDLEMMGDEEGDSLRARMRDLQRSYSIIQTLLNISASITSTLNLQELLRKIVDAVIEITDCDRGFLMLCDDEGELDFTIARSRDQRELSEDDFRISLSVIEKVAASGEPLFLSNVKESDNFKDKRSIIDLNINTAICIPLKYDDRLVGVIYADSAHISRTFSSSDLSIMKAFSGQAVVAIENARRHGELLLTKKTLENQNTSLKKQLAGRFEFSGMVGRSEAMRSIFDTITKVAPLSTTVLIHGETGTGKELIARAIHYNSPRKDKPMMSVNCGALPKDLLESELFGYRKGAFTGAEQDRMGLFEAADGGTIFLDEIGEMAMELQVKLLRTLQEGEVRRLGDDKTRSVDVRLISATNKDLAREVDNGNFRRDLYYRLNVVPILIPPLRERPEDILPLAEFFLEKYSLAMDMKKPSLSRSAKELLLNHKWEGNVRELEHAIERALALSEGVDVIGVSQFEQLISDGSLLELSKETSLKAKLDEWEREFIRRMLIKNGWNVSKTAEALQISRQQLHIKIKRFKLMQ
jgi:Nif-specific regulatory protein